MNQSARRAAVLAGLTSVLALGVAGCSQTKPSDSPAQSNLAIVAQQPIDLNGAQIAAQSGANPANPAGDGKAVCPPLTIAMAGPLTGADSPFGANVRDGAQLAVDQHNAANPGCQVALKAFDTEGDPQKATAVAPQIVDDSSVVGLVGPTWSGETKATGEVFSQAGLVAITPSATNVALSDRGWKTFFRGLSSDGVQGPSLANYLKNGLGGSGAGGARHARPAGRLGLQRVDQEGGQGLLRRRHPDHEPVPGRGGVRGLLHRRCASS